MGQIPTRPSTAAGHRCTRPRPHERRKVRVRGRRAKRAGYHQDGVPAEVGEGEDILVPIALELRPEGLRIRAELREGRTVYKHELGGGLTVACGDWGMLPEEGLELSFRKDGRIPRAEFWICL